MGKSVKAKTINGAPFAHTNTTNVVHTSSPGLSQEEFGQTIAGIESSIRALTAELRASLDQAPSPAPRRRPLKQVLAELAGMAASIETIRKTGAHLWP